MFPTSVPSPALHDALRKALTEHFGSELKIASVERRVSPYSSSFLIEDLDVVLAGGATLPVIFKDLSDSALLQEAKAVKPRIFQHPMREIEVYRQLLHRMPELGTAVFYGAFSDPGAAKYWLFLERLPPTPLWQEGDLESWKLAARWLGAFHSAGLEAAKDFSTVPLIRHDRAFFELWIERARAFVSRNDSASGKKIEWLASRYGGVIEKLSSLPQTVIHGEFYASNILVEHLPSGKLRICPIDWEMAARGPAAADVAALTGGIWTDFQRVQMVRAYREAAPSELIASGEDAFLADLEICRLHQAVQWLGWSPDWSPPREHEQDWLGQALAIAEKMDL